MTIELPFRGWRLLLSLMLLLPAQAAEKPCCTPTGRNALFATATAAPTKKKQKPKVIHLLADDPGRNDVGLHSPEIKTPNLDNPAASGAKLDHYYVQPVCSSIRAFLLTGRYPFRYGSQKEEPK